MAIKPTPCPPDPIQLTKLIGDIATNQVADEVDDGKGAESCLTRTHICTINATDGRSRLLIEHRNDGYFIFRTDTYYEYDDRSGIGERWC